VRRTEGGRCCAAHPKETWLALSAGGHCRRLCGSDDPRQCCGGLQRRACSDSRVQADRCHIAKRHADFRAQKRQILEQIRTKIEAADFAAAVKQAQRYTFANDKDVHQLLAEAREKELLAQLATVAGNDLAKRSEIFRELNALKPADQQYLQQHQHYLSEIQKEQKRELAKQEQARQATLAKLRRKRDKLEHVTFYYDRSSPEYTNANGFFCYIGKNDSSGQPWLRLRVQYYADDWLFIEGFSVYADGRKIDGRLARWERDHDTDIWEWMDEQMTPSDIQMIKAIVASKEATLRLSGRQYRKDVPITAKQKQAMRNVLDAYKLMART